MKINGSLVFDDSSASQVKNLRLERFASATPTHAGAADTGRLVYVASSGIIYVGTASAWVPLATGGDAAGLATELDALEAALGSLIAADGSFDGTNLPAELASATTVSEVLTTLNSLIKSEATARAAADTALQTAVDGVASDLAAEVTRATGAEATLTTNLAAEVTRAQGAESTLTTNLAAEVTRATAAEQQLTTDLAAEVTRATAAEGQLSTDLAAETAARIAGDAANATAVSDEAAARAAADTALQTSLTTEVNRAQAAESDLSDRVTQEVADRAAADTTIANNLAAEITARTDADTAMQAAIDGEIAARAAADTALSNKIDSAIAGLTWENAVDKMVADISTEDLTGLTVRYYDAATNKIFNVVAGVADAGELMVEGAAFFDRNTDVPYVFNGTAMVQFNGAAGLTAGAGLTMSGNTLNVASTSGTITVSADSIDVAQSVLNDIADNATAIAAEATRAQTAESALDTRIDDEIAARQAAISAEHDHHIAGDAVVQAAVDAEVARAQAAEAALQTAIDTLSDSTDAAVAAEAAARDAADVALGGRIDSEAAARSAADTALGLRVDGVVADLAAEVTRATGAEDTLTTNLAAEVSRATAAEAALEAKVEKMYFLYDGASATSHTVTHNLGQKYCNVTVVDASDEMVIPQSVTFSSANELVVTFNTAIACKVIVMGLASGV